MENTTTQIDVGRRIVKNAIVDDCWKLYDEGKYEEAFNKVLPIAEEGYPKAQNMVGLLYYQGKGVDFDVEQAHKWFIRAAKQKYSPAFLNLGNLFYLYGNGNAGKRQSYQYYLTVMDCVKPYMAKRALQMLQEGVVPYNREEEVRWMICLALQKEEEYASELEKIHAQKAESKITMRDLDLYMYQKNKVIPIALLGPCQERLIEEIKEILEDRCERIGEEWHLKWKDKTIECIQFPKEQVRTLGGAVLVYTLGSDFEEKLKKDLSYLKEKEISSVIVYVFDYEWDRKTRMSKEEEEKYNHLRDETYTTMKEMLNEAKCDYGFVMLEWITYNPDYCREEALCNLLNEIYRHLGILLF